MTEDLYELFILEKKGLYKEALDRIQKIRQNTPEISQIRELNLQFLEERIRARLMTGPNASIESQFNQNNKLINDASNNTWSAIITIWKRYDYLAEQLAAIRKQSIPPQEIIVIINEGHILKSKIQEIGGNDIKIIQSDINSLYSRWALAYIAQGEYVSVFDDDVIPGEHWVANAIRACSQYNALIGPSGRIYNKKSKNNFFKLVAPNADPKDKDAINCSDTDIYCDWVCNSYFFKREWVGHILSNMRYLDSFKTFDDIQLATSLYLSGGIRCVTPMQPSFDQRLHGYRKRGYGSDAHTIWKTNLDQHFIEQRKYIEQLIQIGYKPVQQRQNLFRIHLIVPFGERDFLERCLLSIKGQLYQNFTCTLIDDCHDGKDSLDILHRLDLNDHRFRYIKTKKKAYPLRTREIATDMLNAAPADVIAHLDGDDWLPYPDVLSRLDRIYRKGNVLATYGNAVEIRNHETHNFQEYSQYEMSERWNVAQSDPNAKILPLRKIKEDEIINGWGNAPWCGMHLRSFQFIKWIELNKKAFFDENGNYLKMATDAAIFIPILDACKFESVTFIPNLVYVYQNAGNTIHAKKEISLQQRNEALSIINTADRTPNHQFVSQILRKRTLSPVTPSDAAVIHNGLDAPQCDFTMPICVGKKFPHEIVLNQKNSIITIVTPNYLANALICLISYKRNLRSNCDAYIFLATNDTVEFATCTKMLGNSGLTVLSPFTIKHMQQESQALAQKYQIDSDQYRSAVKPVVLLELLKRGYTSALFLDPDTYTVSDITDVHNNITQHPISVFPHFRNPDPEYLRGILYQDGFFSGGMLGATKNGIPHLFRLYQRCLHELVKDPSRQRWDDQKYFDLFSIEVNGLHVNSDRGIDYNPCNYEPVEGMVAPSQRSVLLKSGYFVRHWHVSTMLIKNSIELKERNFSVYRPFISIYLLSLLYTIILISAKSKSENLLSTNVFLTLLQRYDSIEEKLKEISSAIPVNALKQLLALAQQIDANTVKSFINQWVESLLGSICFDNFELFYQLSKNLFPDNDSDTAEIKQRLQKHDLRYITDEIIGAHDLNHDEMVNFFDEAENSGQLIKKQIESLQSCNINY